MTDRSLNRRHDHQTDYECEAVMGPLVAMLSAVAGPREFVVWRAPFRWHDESGPISNMYESFTLEDVASALKAEIIFDFKHAAILRHGASRDTEPCAEPPIHIDCVFSFNDTRFDKATPLWGTTMIPETKKVT